MITAILSVLGWVAKNSYNVVKWFGPRIASIIANTWILATASIFGISTWGLAHWDGVCNAVSQYIDLVSRSIDACQFQTGIAWIDGFMGFFALDSAASYLVSFVAFFLPVVGAVVFTIFVSIIGFVLKLVVYKITVSSTRDLAKT